MDKSKEDYKRRIESCHKELDELLSNCPHWFRELTEKELADEWGSVVALCEICHQEFGWRCKESPDSICHYFTTTDRDGIRCIKLLDGTLDHNFSRSDGNWEWNVNCESNDECLYCDH